MELIKPSAEIVFFTEPAKMMRHIEEQGKKCYQSGGLSGKPTDEFIRGIIDNKHHSVTEHMSFTVSIVCDRGVTHEIVRHRLAAFSQESTRYCNYLKKRFGRSVKFIEPFFFDINEPVQKVILPEFAFSADTNRPMKEFDFDDGNYFFGNSFDIWYMSCMFSEWAYLTLTEQFKRGAQEARSVLPNSLKTEIAITANLREWRHILALRAAGTTGTPHPQMVEVMAPVLVELNNHLPLIFSDLHELYTSKIAEAAEKTKLEVAEGKSVNPCSMENIPHCHVMTRVL